MSIGPESDGAMEVGPEADMIFSDELLATADAMAWRQGLTLERLEHVAAVLAGGEYAARDEETKRKQAVGRTALMLVRVEKPDTTFTTEELVDSLHDSSECERAAAELSDDEFRVTGKQFREANIKMTDDMLNQMGVGEKERTEDFAKSYGHAKALAEERGVTVADVYRDDELYYEADRLAYPAEEAAKRAIKAFNAFNAEVFKNSMVQMFDQMMPAELRADISEDELNELIMEFQLDDSFNQMLDAQLEPLKEAMRQVVTYEFIKAYGSDTFFALPQEQLDIIRPQQPWVREVFGEILEER